MSGYTEAEGFLVELAWALGFENVDDDLEVFKCTGAQLLEYAKRIRETAERKSMVSSGGSSA
jgi:hypothetical protein